jgi:amidase/6-aminohexanoate-cyclic-dimer hydrolase
MMQASQRGSAMGFAEYGRYDGLGLAGLVRAYEVSPDELLDEALERTARVNPQINAVIHLMEGRARAAIADGLPDGPFVASRSCSRTS